MQWHIFSYPVKILLKINYILKIKNIKINEGRMIKTTPITVCLYAIETRLEARSESTIRIPGISKMTTDGIRTDVLNKSKALKSRQPL